MLIDTIRMLDFKNIYYNGCIISEIRDFRQSDYFCRSYFILLKPTNLSLFNDMKKIIGFSKHYFHWSNSTRLKLESKLIYINSPKLCLDPDPYIGILSKRLSNNKLLFGNKLFQNLQRKRLKNISPHKQVNAFKLLEFINVKKPLLTRKIKVISKPENSFEIDKSKLENQQEIINKQNKAKSKNNFKNEKLNTPNKTVIVRNEMNCVASNQNGIQIPLYSKQELKMEPIALPPTNSMNSNFTTNINFQNNINSMNYQLKVIPTPQQSQSINFNHSSNICPINKVVNLNDLNTMHCQIFLQNRTL